MAINADVLRAILAMNSYNRGYNQGIDLGAGTDAVGTPIGTATVFYSDQSEEAQSAGFYSIAHTLASGEKVISYRGTD